MTDPFDEFIIQYRQTRKTSIITKEVLYKVIEDFNNHTLIQSFFQNLKWGFIDFRINFKNWKGHMRGEEWDFWGILNGEWSDYE